MANLFDAANAPEGEPQTIVIGDRVQWKRSDFIADYPSTDYTVRYIARISGGGSNEITVTGTGQTSHYLFTIQSSDSDDFVEGHYYYQLEIERNSDNERITVDRGHFTVVPDLDVNNADPRSHAEIMLTKIESLLSGKADSDVSSYSIAGRSLNKLTFEELVDARNFYRQEVRQEQNEIDLKHGRKNSSTIQVRF
tara:strand:+ start:417 stop:1001 length:585 start_codon:yes stop_codon:yes gene_type:complete